ncbi:spore coat U domain-containing protein [Psychrobacter sp. Pi2-51]|uniref:Csu type fimbrial protein n=1 Tax=Psychrobacter sp. Pi2-51 TaxID=2774132 RepID=UPI00191A3A20|nr:spore coat U domain-containing protein [Psychrobacter sp. Pi2-51]
MKLLRWYYSPILMLGAFWLPLSNTQAAEPNCTAIVNANGIVNLDIITPANAKTASITVPLNYTCTNREITTRYISVCLAVNSGDPTTPNFPPRYMKNTSDTTEKLAFTMTLPGNELWGSRNADGSEFNSGHRQTSGRGTFSGSVPITVKLQSVNENLFATPGEYSLNFNGAHTFLTTEDRLFQVSSDCSGVDQQNQRFPFMVKATVIPSCSVTSTSDVNLGSHSANEKNFTAQNSSAINVTCTKGTPYTIGLTPSNGNQTGLGEMTGTSGNTDKINYQLYSTPGIENKWGNTATSNNVGNGVVGTGDGNSQLKTVYVTVPSADFKPDKYTDIVGIQVNY